MVAWGGELRAGRCGKATRWLVLGRCRRIWFWGLDDLIVVEGFSFAYSVFL